jgi:hypothetical protein
MKSTRAVLLVAALVAVVAPSASAADRPADPASEVEEVYVYDTDTKGNRKGPKVKLSKEEREAHRATAAEKDAAETGRRATEPGRFTLGLSRSLDSGCRGVDVARIGRSLFGFVTYKFWVHKDFCWSYPRVTGANAYTYLTEVDPNFVFRGVINSWGAFYSWCCGFANSGQTSLRQGHFENCILKYGCVRNEYPWVAIYAHGDGSWSYDTGL